MKLTQKQTDKIRTILKNYGIYILDVDSFSILNGMDEIDSEYLNEKINEALEDD